MISVDEAITRILSAFAPLVPEPVPIGAAAGRVLSEDAVSQYDQPPFPVSAMDGYALRANDAATVPTELKVIGSAPAGHPFAGTVGVGEAVRIFTGGIVPAGADSIVIQENAEPHGETVRILTSADSGRHIRNACLDFHRGEVLLSAGKRLSARDVALLAAGGLPDVMVRRKPRLLVAATGDELSAPGEPRKPGGVVASSVLGLSALAGKWGAEIRDLGILPDHAESIGAIAEHTANVDLIVTLGGASVGEHDLVRQALEPKGFSLDFWKIAMRPGKPLIFGRLGSTPFLGLPGNPVSSFVCALLFLKPAVAAMLGTATKVETLMARLSSPLAANDMRQDYLRAQLSRHSGDLWADPFAAQDSSMQKVLAHADALICRAPFAKPATPGEAVEVILLE